MQYSSSAWLVNGLWDTLIYYILAEGNEGVIKMPDCMYEQYWWIVWKFLRTYLMDSPFPLPLNESALTQRVLLKSYADLIAITHRGGRALTNWINCQLWFAQMLNQSTDLLGSLKFWFRFRLAGLLSRPTALCPGKKQFGCWQASMAGIRL